MILLLGSKRSSLMGYKPFTKSINDIQGNPGHWKMLSEDLLPKGGILSRCWEVRRYLGIIEGRSWWCERNCGTERRRHWWTWKKRRDGGGIILYDKDVV
jgi:hypothetical protein